MRCFRRLCDIVDRRYVFTLLRAENERSLEAFVAGITRTRVINFTTSDSNDLFPSRVLMKSLMSWSVCGLECLDLVTLPAKY